MNRLSLAYAFMLAACSSGSDAAPQADPSITPAQAAAAKPFTETVVATFDSPWAMTFLPDGRMLITEKGGRLLLVSADGKKRQVIATVPVDSGGQGGLMDVVPSPTFAADRAIYISASQSGAGGKGVVLMRGALIEPTIMCIRAPCPTGKPTISFETIFRARPFVSGNGHYSGRIAFSPDGKFLFFTNGERQKFQPAQDPKATLGKVLRLTLDGAPAPGNPLASKGFAPEIWSYGHRNLLGIAFDAQGRLWEQEMGPEGGDEVNLIMAGRNYGWPIVSNGRNYGAATDDIPDHPTRPDFEAPKVSWNPVISPSGLIVYSGTLFPAWQGNLFIGGLSSESLIRVEVDGEGDNIRAREAARYAMGARIREVEQGPDGALWLLEDGPGGRLLKLTPR